MLNRESIFNPKLPNQKLHVPEWGGDVFIRRLTAGAYRSLIQRIRSDESSERSIFYWLTATACNEDGTLLFKDEDIPKLESDADAVAIERVVAAAFKCNTVQGVDEATKNLLTRPCV